MAKRPAKNKIKSKLKIKGDHPMVKATFYFSFLFVLSMFIWSFYAFAIGAMNLLYFTELSTILLSFMFPTTVFTWLSLKGKSSMQIAAELGLSRDKFTKRALFAGIKLFFAILILEIALTVVTAFTGVQLPTNVETLLDGMPTWFLLFGIFISPLNEEIFFRGFMVPRIGVIPSALIFAAFHVGYNSIAEFAGAVIFGLLAGYVFKKTGSLYATTLGHLLINMLTIVQFLP